MDILSQAMENIAKRRYQAEDKSNIILEMLLDRPDFRQNHVEIQEQILLVARLEYLGKDASEANEKLASLKSRQITLAEKYGFTAEDLTVQYNCSLCKDRGYVDGKQCACLKSEILRIATSASQSFNPLFTFANSTVSAKIYDITEKYCAKFPNVKFSNIVLTGKTGTGKTYLCCCMVNALIEREIAVSILSAYELQQLLLKEHLADASEKNAYLDSLIAVDALFIDDLGTEPILRNVTEEYLYTLLNERNRLGKATIVSTNLSLTDLKTRYGERIFVRLVDKTRTLVHEMTGNDKRL